MGCCPGTFGAGGRSQPLPGTSWGPYQSRSSAVLSSPDALRGQCPGHRELPSQNPEPGASPELGAAFLAALPPPPPRSAPGLLLRVGECPRGRPPRSTPRGSWARAPAGPRGAGGSRAGSARFPLTELPGGSPTPHGTFFPKFILFFPRSHCHRTASAPPRVTTPWSGIRQKPTSVPG